MDSYYVTHPLTLRSCGQAKSLLPVTHVESPLVTEVYIAAQYEIAGVRAALLRAYPDQALESMLHLLTPKSLEQVPDMPVTLGALGESNDALDTHPLVEQLKLLKANHPARQHYRFLLVNAFGTNLGDNLIGLTAFRQVYAVLREHLPIVSVDVLLGWHQSDSLMRLFKSVEGVDRILTLGLTLAELTRYQALFDTSNLLALPRYGSMPTVDWYLWWMGLKPELIAASAKRNAIAIPTADHDLVAGLLPPCSGPRILISPKASVPLRSMPDQGTLHLVHEVLRQRPDAQLVLLQPLDINHQRVIDLSEHIKTVDRLAALVGLVDGLIGIDSFTQHLADAVATPAVTVFTTVDPGLYPYYPLGESLVLPGAQTLPAWGRPKVSPQEWISMAQHYTCAWQMVDAAAVLHALSEVMARKAVTPLLQVRAAPPARSSTCNSLLFKPDTGAVGVALPVRQRSEPELAILDSTLEKLAKQVLVLGDSVVLLGAGSGRLALVLAGLVGQQGSLVAFEPRRHLHQMLCTNLMGAGITQAQTHAVMPEEKGFSVQSVNTLRADDEFEALGLSNCAVPEPVVCWPLDALRMDACRLLAVCSPMPIQSALKGADQTLRRLQPVVFAGVLKMPQCVESARFLESLNYSVSILELGSANAQSQPPRHGMVIAQPLFMARKGVE